MVNIDLLDDDIDLDDISMDANRDDDDDDQESVDLREQEHRVQADEEIEEQLERMRLERIQQDLNGLRINKVHVLICGCSV